MWYYNLVLKYVPFLKGLNLLHVYLFTRNERNPKILSNISNSFFARSQFPVEFRIERVLVPCHFYNEKYTSISSLLGCAVSCFVEREVRLLLRWFNLRRKRGCMSFLPARAHS